MRLKKLAIKNFKSLKNCSIEFDNLNIIVGPNGSGKTNLIELFELIKSIYVERNRNPFLKWWGYDHVVWNRKEDLNIGVTLVFDYYGSQIEFSTDFTGLGGKFKLIKESISINNVITIVKEGNWLNIQYEEEYLNKFIEIFKRENKEFSLFDPKLIDYKNLINQEIDLGLKDPFGVSILKIGFRGSYNVLKNYSIGLVSYKEDKMDNTNIPENEKIIEIIPLIENKKATTFDDKFVIYGIEVDKKFVINSFKINLLKFLRFPILKRLNFENMKNPFRVTNELAIKIDASNIGAVLYNLFLKNNKIPETVSYLIGEIFPETKLLFDVTTDGRILIKSKEDEIEYYPPCLSDGFFKLLTLATLIDMNPELIVVDEIEDSLYARVIELILDIVSDRNIPVIFTTHSPYVVDSIHPSHLILMEKGDNGSEIRRLKSPEKIKAELNKMKITLSEKWLYGFDDTYY